MIPLPSIPAAPTVTITGAQPGVNVGGGNGARAGTITVGSGR